MIPTLLRSDRQTRDLRHWLAGEGYAPFGWGLGRNVGPTPELMAGAHARLLALAAAHGPVSLVGLSMGGIFARWLAARHSALVRQVITVCSPFRAPLDSFFLPLRSVQRVWRLPNLHERALELERPLPVPGVCLYSKRDGIVAWRSCCEVERPDECIAVDTAHVEIAMNPNVRAVVLEQLRRFTPHPQP